MGYDDSRLSRRTNELMATISQDVQGQGRQATELAIEQVPGSAPREDPLHPRLLVRETTAGADCSAHKSGCPCACHHQAPPVGEQERACPVLASTAELRRVILCKRQLSCAPNGIRIRPDALFGAPCQPCYYGLD